MKIIVESVTLEFNDIKGKRFAHLKVAKFGERTLDGVERGCREILKQKSQIAVCSSICVISWWIF
jgi:hypothetical protein